MLQVRLCHYCASLRSVHRWHRFFIINLTCCLRLFPGNSLDNASERERNILKCVPFGAWSQSECVCVFWSVRSHPTLESGVHCLLTDADDFIDRLENLTSDPSDFLDVCAYNVDVRVEVCMLYFDVVLT